MPKRLWLSATMLVAGASLLVGATFASAAGNAQKLKNGGTWRAAEVGTGETMDPQVTYLTTTWSLEYATAAKLFNYPDKAGAAGKKLLNEVAQSYKISKNGRVYTFTLRKGFRFSDGKPVTAANFVWAIKRVLSDKLQSPGKGFVTDNAGTFITGAKAKGARKLVITLKRPAASLITQLAMPFFQATSTKLPLTKEIANAGSIKDIPSAGPYALTFNDPNRSTQIKKNPFYKKGPGRNRPRHLDGVILQWNQQTQQAYLQTLNGEFDEGPVPPEQVNDVRSRFGVNKTRFWAKPDICTGHIPLNTNSRNKGLFFNNTALRKAVNYAVSRTDYVNARGALGGRPWSNILPPGMPGFTRAQTYPARPQLAKAKKLARGHMKNGKITIWYRSSGVVGPAQKLLITRDMQRLGFSQSNLNFKGFPGADIYDAIGARSADYDMALSVGWCQDYPDPYDFMNVLLSGHYIQDQNNDNWAYFDNKTYNRKADAAARKTGSARIKAYRALDKWVNKKYAPWAAMNTYNNLYLFSNRLNPKSLVYGVYRDFNWTNLALK
jgi:ABC-type transport system substrate-binding protein